MGKVHIPGPYTNTQCGYFIVNLKRLTIYPHKVTCLKCKKRMQNKTVKKWWRNQFETNKCLRTKMPMDKYMKEIA